MTPAAIRKRLALAGALLFSVGMITGLWAAATLTGTVVVGIPRLALIAHLNALLGGLWLLAVAWSFEFLHYGDRGLSRLAIGSHSGVVKLAGHSVRVFSGRGWSNLHRQPR